MGLTILESFVAAPSAVTCAACGRSVVYHDRLSDESRVCLVCSYANALQPSENCMYHNREFDPADRDLSHQMIQICEYDVQHADPLVTGEKIVVPADMIKKIGWARKRFGCSLNALFICALGWFIQVCQERDQAARNSPLDPEGIQSVLSEMPDLDVTTEIPEGALPAMESDFGP